ncbi:metalloregulator ArsR/SmtB family transcription factor [Cellulosimicrobium marinum]|uniref:metalloregulator ArsR/SmtB family transcription factor n=1 Tax=Cellulosimicrobium marinum TaxID=1638992 RepID=UPI001E2B8450|nr:metalloregulator ArsR/SmtB family transcription factor [Cellulosimicrobium marinum]MCB7136253.1 metalloregulator ArsR/SmtB family transcription factor [Cellulosimicrobium marinum]
MDVFEALADPVRRDLLHALRHGDLTAGALAAVRDDVSRPAVSRHLRVLREAGLVDDETTGRNRVYTLRADGLRPVRDLLDTLGAPGVPVPPVPARALDGLDLEVRRTTRDRRAGNGASRQEESA